MTLTVLGSCLGLRDCLPGTHFGDSKAVLGGGSISVHTLFCEALISPTCYFYIFYI